jgi:energy-coupling factor transport system substrate-specific component
MRRGDQTAQVEAAHRKRTALSALLIFGGIPAVIALGATLLRDRQYLLVSWIILLLTAAPFFLVFERRRPKAREIVLIAMMSALTVCAQLLCQVTVALQAGTAIIIASGIALGPEAGFLIGALARFVLNFYIGQGPWTPWQMFCWGVLGFLAGLTFNRATVEKIKSRDFKLVMGPLMCIGLALLADYLYYLLFHEEGDSFFGWRLYVFGAVGLLLGLVVQRKRLPVDGVTLTLFTFFVTFLVYGGLMNICAMVSAASIPGAGEISWATLKLLYLSGAPYDAIHAASAALCSFLFGDKLIRKLERIKLKYGIYR